MFEEGARGLGHTWYYGRVVRFQTAFGTVNRVAPEIVYKVLVKRLAVIQCIELAAIVV